MKKFIIYLSLLIGWESGAFAAKSCFLVQEVGGVTKSEGDCGKRYSPCSTFKIALALMGYDDAILSDETHPEWPAPAGYDMVLEAWKNPQNPTTWIKNSCVWYSQLLTPKLGAKKFKAYVKEFGYGNQDVTGDKGKNNGLTHSWLSSSLEIAPVEQAVFLKQLLAHTLPVSLRAQQMTANILYEEDLPNGWKLYGKTGSGVLLSPDRRKKLNIKHGWFVGWVEKNSKKIIFVSHIVDDKEEKEYAGPRTKQQTKEKLLQIIEKMKTSENNVVRATNQGG